MDSWRIFVCGWYSKGENALVLRIHHVTLNFPNCFLSWSKTKDCYLYQKMGSWAAVCTTSDQTCPQHCCRNLPKFETPRHEQNHTSAVLMPTTPRCQQTKTAFLSFYLPNLAQCLSVEEYNQNPAGKRIWGMQGELRRIRTHLKFNKLYVVSPTP